MSHPNDSHDAEHPRKGCDYEVGYCRPPLATRFRPGQITNPKGRSKKPKTVGKSLADLLKKRIEITEDGKTRTMTMQDIIMHRLMHRAAKGDLKAIQMLFALMDRYQDSPDTSLDPLDLAPEDQRI